MGGQKEKGKGMWIIKLESENQKKEVMKKKALLRGRKERVMDDLTWKERNMKWNLEQIAKEEEILGKKVWVGYNRIRIDSEWWIYNEEGRS